MKMILLKGKIILFYLLVIYFSFLQPFTLYLWTYSSIVLLLIFLFLLYFPFFFCRFFNFDSFKAVNYALIFSTIIFILLLITGYALSIWFKNFSYSKWKNPNYCDIRYNMVDSLNKKYDFVGMNKEKVYELLGDPNKKTCKHDYEEDNKVCNSIYSNSMDNYFYCLYFNDENIVIKTEDNSEI